MKNTPVAVIIPARYASTRFPGKPLALLAGKPMIQHVWEKAIASKADAVAVATDDERIAAAVEKFGGKAISVLFTRTLFESFLIEQCKW